MGDVSWYTYLTQRGVQPVLRRAALVKVPGREVRNEDYVSPPADAENAPDAAIEHEGLLRTV